MGDILLPIYLPTVPIYANYPSYNYDKCQAPVSFPFESLQFLQSSF